MDKKMMAIRKNFNLYHGIAPLDAKVSECDIDAWKKMTSSPYHQIQKILLEIEERADGRDGEPISLKNCEISAFYFVDNNERATKRFNSLKNMGLLDGFCACPELTLQGLCFLEDTQS